MIDSDEETCSLTLRSVRWKTVDWLYELKASKDKPICQLVDEIVSDFIETDPSLREMREADARRLAEEYGAMGIRWLS